MGKMDPRVYYKFRKFAKAVQSGKERIECVVIGTRTAEQWIRQGVNLTLDEKTGIPTQNRAFGVPVVWMKGAQGAQIQYLDAPKRNLKLAGATE